MQDGQRALSYQLTVDYITRARFTTMNRLMIGSYDFLCLAITMRLDVQLEVCEPKWATPCSRTAGSGQDPAKCGLNASPRLDGVTSTPTLFVGGNRVSWEKMQCDYLMLIKTVRRLLTGGINSMCDRTGKLSRTMSQQDEVSLSLRSVPRPAYIVASCLGIRHPRFPHHHGTLQSMFSALSR